MSNHAGQLQGSFLRETPRLNVPNVHRLVFWALLILGAASLLVAVASAGISFTAAKAIVDSFSAKGNVEHFTPGAYALIPPMLGAGGLALWLAAILWQTGRSRTLPWLDRLTATTALSNRLDRSQWIQAWRTTRWGEAVLLFLSFWPFYLFTSLFLKPAISAKYFFQVFDVDTAYVIPAISGWAGEGPRHPLFKMFFAPSGLLLRLTGLSTIDSALIINSLFGGLCVFLLVLFLERVGLPPGVAALWAAITGLSAAHIFYASAPETFIFSAFGLILLFTLAAAAPGNLLAFIPAAVFSAGVTITNIITAGIAFFFSLRDKGSRFKAGLSRVVLFLVATLSILILLDVVGILAFRSGVPFFWPWFYSQEAVSYSTLENSESPLHRFAILAEDMFVYDLAAPRLYLPKADVSFTTQDWSSLRTKFLDEAGIPNVLVTFDTSSLKTYRLPGAAAAIIWLSLFLVGLITYAVHPPARTPLTKAILVCLGFNFTLHLFYGFDMFLYAAHWTFLVTGFAALTLKRWSHSKLLVGCLLVLAALLLLNNLGFLTDLYFIFQPL